MKGNVIQMNTLHLNSVRLNGIGKVQSVSLKGGSTEDPVFPPVEPPVEPEPTPTYTLSASVTNGKVSATLNGSAVNLPYTANEGDTIVVEVTPNDGYTFEGWADGNTDNPRSITMTADVVLSAECVEVAQPPVGNYIQFEDKAVEAICVANWSSDGIGLTEEDAAAVTTIGSAFSQNKEITSFDEFRYFTGVTSLSFAAFSGCSKLATIDLSNITEIKAEAFRNCTELSIEVIIPNVANILKQTFANTKITKLVAENIVTIESSAFGSCVNFKYVDLGASVQSIGWGAFSGCSALESVIVRATTPPSLAAEAFKFSSCPIYVPDASLEAYKTALNWVSYADRIHPLSEIEGSPYIQFEDAEVERVLMANGVSSDGIGITKEDAAAVTSIGTWFKGNTAMTSFNELQYFTGLTALEAEAFRECSALEEIKVPSNIALVDAGAFYATKIRSIVMLNVVTVSSQWQDGYNTFGRCANLQYALFGKNTQSIAPYIFKKAAKCIMIVLASEPPVFNGDSFDYDGAPTYIYVPNASVNSYAEATNWNRYASKIKGISQLATDNPTLYAEIQQYL